MQADLDQTLAALADPVRRALVDRLRRGPARSGELAAALGLPRPTVSKHPDLDFSHVDAIEKTGIDLSELGAFVDEGGLGGGQ